MKRVAVVVSLALFIYSSCTNKNTYNEIENNDFPKRINFQAGKELSFKLHTKLAMIKELDNHFILFSLTSPDSGIYIFNKKHLSLEKRTGKRGRGPNEIGRYGTLFTNLDSNSFFVADFQKFLIWKYNVDELFLDNMYQPKKFKEFKLFPGAYPLDFVLRKNSLFTLTISEHLIAKYNEHDSITYIAPFKEELTGFICKEERNKAYETRMTTWKNEKTAFAFRYSNIIAITHENFDPIWIIKGPGKNSSGEHALQDVVYHYQIKSDKHYIYTALLNKPLYERDEKYGDYISKKPKCINIYSWQGEPIAEIYLPLGFTDFYLDRENERIIAFHPEKSHPLHVYNLKDKINL